MAVDAVDVLLLHRRLSSLMKKIVKRAVTRFIPSFSDSALFTMGLSLLLLFILDSNLRGMFLSVLRTGDYDFIVPVVLYFLGLILAVINVFSSRQKSEHEKFALITFAIASNVVAGFFAGSLALANSSGLLSVFPALCIFNSCLLIALCMHGFIGEPNISDENAGSGLEILIGAVIVISIVMFATLYTRLHWSETYSMCIVYCSNVNAPLSRLFKLN